MLPPHTILGIKVILGRILYSWHEIRIMEQAYENETEKGCEVI